MSRRVARLPLPQCPRQGPHDVTHTPKGCQVDHVTPLAKGGADTPSNMQLLCGEALKAKERTELR